MTENRCNTVLVAYSALPKILKDHDLAFKTRLNSSFMSRHLRAGVSTEALVTEMLQINERKAAALALADIVRTALTTLPAPLSEALVLRFVKGKTFQEIALKQNVTLRTAFRRFDRARELFAAALDKLGLTERVFADTYLTDPAIAAAVSRLDDGAYFTAKSQNA